MSFFLAEFVLAVRKVAIVAIGAHAAVDVVFAERGFIDVVGRLWPAVGLVAVEASVLRNAEAKVGDARSFFGGLFEVSVAAREAVDAEALLVKDALRFVVLGDVAVRAVGNRTLDSPAAHGHALGVVLMQELALLALHAQTLEPVTAHDRAELLLELRD